MKFDKNGSFSVYQIGIHESCDGKIQVVADNKERIICFSVSYCS